MNPLKPNLPIKNLSAMVSHLYVCEVGYGEDLSPSDLLKSKKKEKADRRLVEIHLDQQPSRQPTITTNTKTNGITCFISQKNLMQKNLLQ